MMSSGDEVELENSSNRSRPPPKRRGLRRVSGDDTASTRAGPNVGEAPRFGFRAPTGGAAFLIGFLCASAVLGVLYLQDGLLGKLPLDRLQRIRADSSSQDIDAALKIQLTGMKNLHVRMSKELTTMKDSMEQLRRGQQQDALEVLCDSELMHLRKVLEEKTRELELVKLNYEEYMSRTSGGECRGRKPTAGNASLYKEKGLVLDLEKSDKMGGWEQKGKQLTVDDVAFGYDVLYEAFRLFEKQKWNGMMMLQDPMDAFAINDFLWTTRPDVMIEMGTAYGGSAVFFAEIMVRYNPNAHVITIDPVNLVAGPTDHGKVKANSSDLWGTTIRQINGFPNSQEVVDEVTALLTEWGVKNIFLNEDSVHDAKTVLANVEAYEHLVQPCNWILFQDTKMSRMDGRPGPIWAQRKFRDIHPEYVLRRDWEYFIYTQHAQGWVQKRGPGCGA